MTGPVQPGCGRSPRGDDGLTTLEWLLIVAAVAGFAALSVVIVQAYVEDTGDRISNPNPRVVSAMVAAEEVMGDADRDADQQPAAAKTYGPWSDHFTKKCKQLGIIYNDTKIQMEAQFELEPGGTPRVELTDEVDAGVIDTSFAGGFSVRVPQPGEAVASCVVTLK